MRGAWAGSVGIEIEAPHRGGGGGIPCSEIRDSPMRQAVLVPCRRRLARPLSRMSMTCACCLCMCLKWHSYAAGTLRLQEQRLADIFVRSLCWADGPIPDPRRAPAQSLVGSAQCLCFRLVRRLTRKGRGGERKEVASCDEAKQASPPSCGIAVEPLLHRRLVNCLVTLAQNTKAKTNVSWSRSWSWVFVFMFCLVLYCLVLSWLAFSPHFLYPCLLSFLSCRALCCRAAMPPCR